MCLKHFIGAAFSRVACSSYRFSADSGDSLRFILGGRPHLVSESGIRMRKQPRMAFCHARLFVFGRDRGIGGSGYPFGWRSFLVYEELALSTGARRVSGIAMWCRWAWKCVHSFRLRLLRQLDAIKCKNAYSYKEQR